MTPESLTTVYLSQPGFFLRWSNGNLLGLTGTVGSKANRDLLTTLYNVDIRRIPTELDKKHEKFVELLVENAVEWEKEVLSSIAHNVAVRRRAVLVICESIEAAESIHEGLKGAGLGAQAYLYVSSLENSEAQRDIYALKKYGFQPGDVLVSTNLAGRGMHLDVSQKVEDAGGLHVIGGFPPKNDRVAEQAEGRTSRQGRRGSSEWIYVYPKTAVEKLRKELIAENSRTAGMPPGPENMNDEDGATRAGEIQKMSGAELVREQRIRVEEKSLKSWIRVEYPPVATDDQFFSQFSTFFRIKKREMDTTTTEVAEQYDDPDDEYSDDHAPTPTQSASSQAFVEGVIADLMLEWGIFVRRVREGNALESKTSGEGCAPPNDGSLLCQIRLRAAVKLREQISLGEAQGGKNSWRFGSNFSWTGSPTIKISREEFAHFLKRIDKRIEDTTMVEQGDKGFHLLSAFQHARIGNALIEVSDEIDHDAGPLSSERHWNLSEGDFKTAKQHLEMAIKKDPDFATGAYWGFATIHIARWRDNKSSYKDTAVENLSNALRCAHNEMAINQAMLGAVQRIGRASEDKKSALREGSAFFLQVMAKANVLGTYVRGVKEALKAVERSRRLLTVRGIRRFSDWSEIVEVNKVQRLKQNNSLGADIDFESTEKVGMYIDMPPAVDAEDNPIKKEEWWHKKNYKENQKFDLKFHDLTRRHDMGNKIDQAYKMIDDFQNMCPSETIRIDLPLVQTWEDFGKLVLPDRSFRRLSRDAAIGQVDTMLIMGDSDSNWVDKTKVQKVSILGGFHTSGPYVSIVLRVSAPHTQVRHNWHPLMHHACHVCGDTQPPPISPHNSECIVLSCGGRAHMLRTVL